MYGGRFSKMLIFIIKLTFMEVITGIYKITSPNNKIYIGSSKNIKNRFNNYKILKCKTQRKLYNSFLKYGVENHLFEIIEECVIDILLEREFYYGTLFNVLNKKNGLNCRLPKFGENYIYMSDETKRKIGKSNKGKYIGFKHEFYESSLKKLTKENVIKIKELLIENKFTQTEIGVMFNVNRKIISRINTGQSYESIGKEINLSLSKKKYIKLNMEDYNMILKMNKENVLQSEIAKQFNISQSHVSRIISNKRYLKTLVRKEGV